ncbi:hypothetical protein NDU88_003263 [Pleurodeles waltl]|uniref:Uncharacterized protein n=1 Tax=Pleurodeles waltl TaxID=8319 RepID=A0AAV7MTR9_PLEWA|nr:hypothetical protein NDU88_003263 [Pleurodeles waltl]
MASRRSINKRIVKCMCRDQRCGAPLHSSTEWARRACAGLPVRYHTLRRVTRVGACPASQRTLGDNGWWLLALRSPCTREVMAVTRLTCSTSWVCMLWEVGHSALPSGRYLAHVFHIMGMHALGSWAQCSPVRRLPRSGVA